MLVLIQNHLFWFYQSKVKYSHLQYKLIGNSIGSEFKILFDAVNPERFTAILWKAEYFLGESNIRGDNKK